MNKPSNKKRKSVSIETKSWVIYGYFKNYQYTPWIALSEYVDNSVQSYLDNKKELSKLGCEHVSVNIDIGSDLLGEYISIEDDAGGIADDRFENAFKIIKHDDETRNLNEFGIGMKLASIWFGNYFTVETSALGEPFKTKVVFDIKDIEKNESEEISGKNLLVSKANVDDHFTRIEITKLNSAVPQGATITKIRDHLQDIHSQFLKDKQLKLTLCSQNLKYRERKALEKEYWKNDQGPMTKSKYLWKKNFRIELSKPYEYAEGHIGLLPKLSKIHSGLMIFRRGRAVYGSGAEVGEKYKPNKLFGASNLWMYRRLFGSFTVGSDSPVSSSKTLVLEPVEEELLVKLKEILEGNPREFEKDQSKLEVDDINNILPMGRMGRKYRIERDRQLNQGKKQKRAEEATKTTGNLLEGYEVAKEIKEILENPEEPSDSLVDFSEPVLAETNIKVTVSKTIWDITFSIIENPTKDDWFIYERTKRSHAIHVRVNLEHPFTKNFIDKDGVLMTAFLRIAAALALAEIVCDEQNTKHASALRHTFNRIMRGSISSKVPS